jgi:hypothetical protein
LGLIQQPSEQCATGLKNHFLRIDTSFISYIKYNTKLFSSQVLNSNQPLAIGFWLKTKM